MLDTVQARHARCFGNMAVVRTHLCFMRKACQVDAMTQLSVSDVSVLAVTTCRMAVAVLSHPLLCSLPARYATGGCLHSRYSDEDKKKS